MPERQGPRASVDRILAAAGTLFGQRGYDATPMAAVAAEAKVSNGSLFHHFPTKADLGATVYLSGLTDFQSTTLAALRSSRDSHEAVNRFVASHLGWTQDHPLLAQYLSAPLAPEVRSAAQPDLGAQESAYRQGFASWVHAAVALGAVRPLDPAALSALLVGPPQEYARAWMADRALPAPRAVAGLLGEGAWRSVRSGRRP